MLGIGLSVVARGIVAPAALSRQPLWIDVVACVRYWRGNTMRHLLARCRASAFWQYFENLEPVDRATFWILAALALAIGISFSALARHREADNAAPRLTAPPFTLDFADAWVRGRA